MKKLLTLVAIVLFTISAGAQEKKAVAKEVAKKESCCAKKESAKTMTADEIAKCQIKCKAEGKKCDVAMADKKCDSKAMTAAEVAKCKAKCKAEGKKCDASMAGTEEKKCCAKKA